MIDPDKLTKFLTDAREHNRKDHDDSDYNGFKDPYWLGRIAMCNTLLGWVEAGIFEEEKDD